MKVHHVLFTIAFALILTATPRGVAAADAGKRPNILFIFSDDHAYQAISAYGSGLNKTPNIDRLAAEGMRFDRCLTTYSLCGPSRACILTGKYSHLNGFYNNYNSRFDGSQVTLPKLMKQAGYQTAIIGKWHLVSDPTGFDFWEVLPGQGQYYNPPMTRNGQLVKKQGYVTDIITDDSLDWLKNQRDPNKPFLLMCQHKAPHREWEPALKNLNLNDGVKFPEPATLFDDYTGRGKAEHEQDMTIAKTMNNRDVKLAPPPTLNPQQQEWDAYYNPIIQRFKANPPAGQDLVRWKFQRYMHDYLATIASVDESVGRLLDYLKESGLDQNTIVVYSSDQGFYLGEHGWFDKRWIFEESLRTPLLVRWPGVIKPGSVNSDIVSNLDFPETLLEAAGATPPADMQGHSLVPVMKGQTPADWRKTFYYHYYEHPAVHNVARQYGVVTDRYKLVHFYEPEMNYWELFDLKTDPHEMKSVYGEPQYAAVQKDLHQELTRLRVELKVPDQDPPSSIIARQAADQAREPVNAWVVDYHFDKDEGDKVVDASGHHNDGTAHNAPVVEGRAGAKARRFDGSSWIDLLKSASLNPAVGHWCVEAEFKADQPDGILLAHGGGSFGYCLAIEGGKPGFIVVVNGERTRVNSSVDVKGKWSAVQARFDEENVSITVDGKPAGKVHLENALRRNPAEGMQIGADLGSTVLAAPLPKFTGMIESIRVYSGEAP